MFGHQVLLPSVLLVLYHTRAILWCAPCGTIQKVSFMAVKRCVKYGCWKGHRRLPTLTPRVIAVAAAGYARGNKLIAPAILTPACANTQQCNVSKEVFIHV